MDTPTAPDRQQPAQMPATNEHPSEQHQQPHQRHVWDSRYGRMLIEVVGHQVFVNGSPVQTVPVPPDGKQGSVRP